MTRVDTSNDLRTALHERRFDVMILTSSNERVDLMSGCRLGANSYVRKPVSYSDFLSATRQIASYWLSLNEGLSPISPP